MSRIRRSRGESTPKPREGKNGNASAVTTSGYARFSNGRRNTPGHDKDVNNANGARSRAAPSGQPLGKRPHVPSARPVVSNPAGGDLSCGVPVCCSGLYSLLRCLGPHGLSHFAILDQRQRVMAAHTRTEKRTRSRSVKTEIIHALAGPRCNAQRPRRRRPQSPSLRIFAMHCPFDFPFGRSIWPQENQADKRGSRTMPTPSPTGTRWSAVSRMIGFVLAKNGSSIPTNPCDANLLLNTTVFDLHKV